MNDVCVIGTRGSALALAQAVEIRDRLRKAHPRLAFEIKIIKTSGDKMKTARLAKSGTKGLFTKELEEALLRRKISLAVHSLKDLPTSIPAGLALAAVPEREDPRDVLVVKDPDWSPEKGGRVASSSPRRQFQLKHRWPKLETADIRGNIETRLQKLLDRPDWDAVVLAGAGLLRLGLLRPSRPDTVFFESGLSKTGMEVRDILGIDAAPAPRQAGGRPLPCRWLSLKEMLPAPGQAALGIETRADDERTQSLAERIGRFRSQAEVMAERSFLAAMGGGCLQPVAAIGKADNDQLVLHGVVFSADGLHRWDGEVRGPLRDHEALGRELADELKSKGAKL